jgi:hypothetical protein
VGVPLVAESHVAGFYPPNWLFYRLWDVGTAYRLTLWLHSVALAAATFAYARALGIGRAGSALAAVSFALCGFQAVHAVHEPFYHVMPYLPPVCPGRQPRDRRQPTGRLALAWGAVVLGHFQIQMDGRGAAGRRVAGVFGGGAAPHGRRADQSWARLGRDRLGAP